MHNRQPLGSGPTQGLRRPRQGSQRVSLCKPGLMLGFLGPGGGAALDGRPLILQRAQRPEVSIKKPRQGLPCARRSLRGGRMWLKRDSQRHPPPCKQPMLSSRVTSGRVMRVPLGWELARPQG